MLDEEHEQVADEFESGVRRKQSVQVCGSGWLHTQCARLSTGVKDTMVVIGGTVVRSVVKNIGLDSFVGLNYQDREVLISINREGQHIGMLVDVQESV